MSANMTPFDLYLQALAHFHAAIKDSFECLLTQTAGQGAINEEMMISQVKELALAISEQYPDGPLTRDDLVLLLNTEWDRVADRYEQGWRGEAVYQREEEIEGKCYSTCCPFCGFANGLSVVHVTLTFHRHRGLEVDAPLREDGFDVLPWVPAAFQHSDLTTEEEQVVCGGCDHHFELSFVTLARFRKEVSGDRG